jgi:hypothetical protein
MPGALYRREPRETPAPRRERVGMVHLGVVLSNGCRVYDDHLFLRPCVQTSKEGAWDGRSLQDSGRPACHYAAVCMHRFVMTSQQHQERQLR